MCLINLFSDSMSRDCYWHVRILGGCSIRSDGPLLQKISKIFEHQLMSYKDDYNRQPCIMFVLFSSDSGKCCGGTWIDNNHTCCDRQPRLGIGQCCGTDKVVDPRTHMCCMDASQSSSVPYDVQTIESGQGSHFACCGLRSYNRLEEECCHGVSDQRCYIPYPFDSVYGICGTYGIIKLSRDKISR